MNRELQQDADLVALQLKRMGLQGLAKKFLRNPLVSPKSWHPVVEDKLFMGELDRRGVSKVMSLLHHWGDLAERGGLRLKSVRMVPASARRVASQYLMKTASWEVEEWFDLRRPIEGYSSGRILAEEDSLYLELHDEAGEPVFEEVKTDWFTDDPEEEAQSAVDDMIAELQRGKIPRDFRYIDL